MSFLADFTAIDFETANRRTDSACQLAAVVVREGQIVDERMWMIRPDPFFFSAGNIRIHGIRPKDVEDEPTFGELWDDIRPFVTDDCLIAHNAGFDIGVMLGCLERHGHEIPELRFSCTRLIAKQTWPERMRFGLKPLSNWLGVDFKHHDALEDSIACAKVLLAAGIACEAVSLEDLENKLRLQRGKAGKWGVQQASTKGRQRSRSKKSKPRSGLPKRTLRRGDTSRQLTLPLDPFDEQAMTREDSPRYRIDDSTDERARLSADLQRLAIRAEFIQPLRGKSIVLCGRLRTLTRDQAIDLTRRSGGQFQDTPNDQTNCIVMGSEADAGQASALEGAAIEIVSESEFLGMIGMRS